jgi:putative transposase
MPIPSEIIDELMRHYQKPEDLIGEQGILEQLKKALLERAMQGELTHHLGYDKHGARPTANARNGTSRKTVRDKNSEVTIEVPRDREGTFEPKLIPKHQRRWNGFDEKIIALYARGMTTNDIRYHLEELYQVEVSAELISTVTDAVLDEVRTWQARTLDPVYPILYLDALVVKIRHDGRVVNKHVYVALGVDLTGRKEVLGLWIAETEGAKFWLSVVTELKNRGLQDVFIACVDGLKGFPEAIAAVFPNTQVQLCIVHLVRNSLAYVNDKHSREVVADLKTIYRAATLDEAERCLDDVERKWLRQYPMLVRAWRTNWANIIPFFAFPEEIRRAIYTTNAIESLNSSLRKILGNRSLFPNDDAVLKLVFLALRNAAKRWTMPIRNWKSAMNQFAIIYEDRVPIPTS